MNKWDSDPQVDEQEPEDNLIYDVEKITQWAQYNALEIPSQLLNPSSDHVFYTTDKETGNVTLFEARRLSELRQRGEVIIPNNSVSFHQNSELEEVIIDSDANH